MPLKSFNLEEALEVNSYGSYTTPYFAGWGAAVIRAWNPRKESLCIRIFAVYDAVSFQLGLWRFDVETSEDLREEETSSTHSLYKHRSDDLHLFQTFTGKPKETGRRSIFAERLRTLSAIYRGILASILSIAFLKWHTSMSNDKVRCTFSTERLRCFTNDSTRSNTDDIHLSSVSYLPKFSYSLHQSIHSLYYRMNIFFDTRKNNRFLRVLNNIGKKDPWLMKIPELCPKCNENMLIGHNNSHNDACHHLNHYQHYHTEHPSSDRTNWCGQVAHVHITDYHCRKYRLIHRKLLFVANIDPITISFVPADRSYCVPKHWHDCLHWVKTSSISSSIHKGLKQIHPLSDGSRKRSNRCCIGERKENIRIYHEE